MIVFDLRCANRHVFEAWFGSSADYEAQRGGGLLSCPLCGDTEVTKALMAPNLAKRSAGEGRAEAPIAVAAPGPNCPVEAKAMIAALAKAQAAMLETSEWVGRRFADQARAMHLGEREQRAIHGQATIEEAKALAEEGVAIAPLPFPVTPPEALN